MSKNIDLLEGNIFSSLTRLALPIMATSLIQMAYNMTDMIWIGILGSDAVAAVGAAGMYVWLSNGLAALARMGGQVKVAHSLGARNREEASIYASNALKLCIILALIYTVVVHLFTGSLISFFKLSGTQTIADANVYLRIVITGLVFTFLNQVMTGLVTATGNSRTPFAVTTVGLIFNIVFDPILIFGVGPVPALGVAGAAIATVVAQVIVFVLYFIYAKRDEVLFATVNILAPIDREHLKEIVRIGLPTAVQSTLFTGINMVLARMVANWGDVAIAVQKVGGQIESLAWMTAEGFAAAVNSFVGQNYGAGNFTRAKKGYFTALGVISVWGAIVTMLLIFVPEPLFRIFIREAEAIPYGISYLMVLGVSQLPMCIEIITSGAFSGFGKTLPPSVISIIFTTLRIPMAAVLSATALALDGIWWSVTISSILKGVILLIAFLIFIRRNEGRKDNLKPLKEE